MNRRRFLVAGLAVGAVGGGLLVGVGRVVGGRVGGADALPAHASAVGLNGWVRIAEDGTVFVTVASVEMGQGVTTALPMIVAEELDLPLSQIQVEAPERDARYGNRAVFGASWWFHPDNEHSLLARNLVALGETSGALLGVQVTGGSSSVRDGFETLRWAGATARALLVAEAADRWNVSVLDCSTRDGAVWHAGQRLGFGSIAADAARRPIPSGIHPKEPAQRKLLGTAAPRLDLRAKVTGTAVYGIDVRLPGMLFGAIHAAPNPGASVESLDDTAAKAMPGVLQVVPYEGLAGCRPGVGVIARDTWQAQLAASACRIRWSAGPEDAFSTDSLMRALSGALDGADEGFVFHRRGEGRDGLAQAARTLSADYSAPWLAHATLEPMNCTAQWVDGRLRLWVPTQAPTFALDTAARASGLDGDQIDLQVTQMGGGFGRRLETDYLVPAIALARAAAPVPVQVLWSREQDFAHDFYRPGARCRLQGGVDEQGRLTTWITRSASDAVSPQFLARNYPLLAKMNHGLPDRTQAEGLWDQAYEIPNRHCAHLRVDSPVPVGNWRSVGHSHMAFFAESFLDELAHFTGTDPYAFRRALLAEHPRQRAVLDLAANKAGWGSALPVGRARGMALHESFGTVVAQVAEVSVDGGRPRVHRVVCAVDCGTVINPDIVAQQVEGSVIFGLSACLHGEITFRDGRVEQANFPDYPLLRLRDAPAIETWIVPSDAPPSGMGEPALPPVAPAVANAIFALTGERLRSMPLRLNQDSKT